MSRTFTLFATAAALAAATTLQAQTTGSTGSGSTGTGSGSTGTSTGTSTGSSTGTAGGSTGTMGQGSSGSMSGGAMHGGSMSGTSRRGGMGRSGQVDSTIVTQLDSVNTAAKAGLTNLAPSAAAALVGSIQSKLSGSRNAQLRSISTDLGALQRELSASTVNGRRVAPILRRLGTKTTWVASSQSGAIATTLREIGSELTSAARQLSGGAASGAAAPAGTR